MKKYCDPEKLSDFTDNMVSRMSSILTITLLVLCCLNFGDCFIDLGREIARMRLQTILRYYPDILREFNANGGQINGGQLNGGQLNGNAQVLPQNVPTIG